MNEENKLVNIDYFLANKELIESIKNKKIMSAIAVLLKFHSEDYLLSDSNTQRITSATQNTVFLFNQALIKDISKSYELLEDSVSLIRDSEYQELLVDSPRIFGKEIEYMEQDRKTILAKKRILNWQNT